MAVSAMTETPSSGVAKVIFCILWRVIKPLFQRLFYLLTYLREIT